MDAIESAYKEILKNELCIVRNFDLCEDKSVLGYEVRTRLTFHKFDSMLTIYDIVYSLNQAAIKFGVTLEDLLNQIVRNKNESLSKKIKEFINIMEEKGLLYEFEWNDIKGLISDKESYELSSIDDFLLLKRINFAKKSLPSYILGDLREFNNKGFKTLHGFVLKLLRHAGPLPHDSRVLEAYMLPFLEEKIPERKVDIESLRPYLQKYFENNNVSIETAAKVSNFIIRKLKESNFASKLTEYQAKMIEEMLTSQSPKIGVISAPTGSGKTIIFFIYTIAKTILNKLNNKEMKSIIVYPRKTLAREQLERLISVIYHINKDIEKELGLSKIRISIYDGDSPRSKKEISGKKSKYTDFRKIRCPSGELIKYCSTGDEIKLRCGNEEIDWLSEIKDEYLYSDIIITNHSQLSTNLFYSFKSARSSIFDKISLMVFDEAHVYTEKGLGDFLYFLLTQIIIYQLETKLGSNKIDVSKIEEYIGKIIRESNLDLIFSSATLLSKKIDENIEFRSFGGLKYDIFEEKNNKFPDAINKFLEFILWKIKDYYNEIIYEPYSKYLEDSKETRLIIPVIYFPSPDSSPTSLFLWDTTYLMLLSEASMNRLRGVFKNGLTGILFVDNKEQQSDLDTYFIENYTMRERDIEDKLLVSIINENSKYGKMIAEMLKNSPEDVFYNYSAIPLFYDNRNIKQLISNWTTLVQSNKFPGFNPIEFSARINSIAQSAIRNGSKDLIDDVSHVYYFMFHNADINRDERIEKEEMLRQGNFRVVLSTSTLELGVDLPNIGFILQLGVPIQGDSIIQRFGRGGRSNDTFRISLGILVAKNTGPDIALIDENYAIRKIFFNNKDLTTLRGEREIETVKAYAYLALTNFIHYTLKDKVWEIIQNQNWENIISAKADNFLDIFLRLTTNLDPKKLKELKEEIKDSYISLLVLMRNIQTASNIATINGRTNPSLVERGKLNDALNDLMQAIALFKRLDPNNSLLEKLDKLLQSIIGRNGEVYLPKLYPRTTEFFSVYFELMDAKNKLKDNKGDTRLMIYNQILPKIEKIVKLVSPVLLPKFSSSAESKNLFIYLFTYFSKPEMPHYALKQKDASLYTYNFDGEYRGKRNGRPRSEILYREIPLRRRER